MMTLLEILSRVAYEINDPGFQLISRNELIAEINLDYRVTCMLYGELKTVQTVTPTAKFYSKQLTEGSGQSFTGINFAVQSPQIYLKRIVDAQFLSTNPPIAFPAFAYDFTQEGSKMVYFANLSRLNTITLSIAYIPKGDTLLLDTDISLLPQALDDQMVTYIALQSLSKLLSRKTDPQIADQIKALQTKLSTTPFYSGLINGRPTT